MGVEVACKKERVWLAVHETSFHRRVLDALMLAVSTLSCNDRCKRAPSHETAANRFRCYAFSL